MIQHPHLAHAPIQEAVVDFRVKERPGASTADLDKESSHTPAYMDKTKFTAGNKFLPAPFLNPYLKISTACLLMPTDHSFVEPSDIVARFLLQRDDFSREKNRVKPRAFLPPRASAETSVFRTGGVHEMDIWTIGTREVASPHNKELLGRADITNRGSARHRP